MPAAFPRQTGGCGAKCPSQMIFELRKNDHEWENGWTMNGKIVRNWLGNSSKKWLRNDGKNDSEKLGNEQHCMANRSEDGWNVFYKQFVKMGVHWLHHFSWEACPRSMILCDAIHCISILNSFMQHVYIWVS